MSTYEIALLVMAVLIVYLGVRLVLKVRELSSYKSDEAEEQAAALTTRLPKDLQNLKIEEPHLENWDNPPPSEKHTGDESK